MHGDTVVAKIKPGGFPAPAAPKAASSASLGRAHASVVGLFRYGPRGNVVLPYDIRIQHEIEIPAGDELTPALREKLGLPADQPGARNKRLPVLPELDGAVVNVELIRYSREGAPPIGRVIEILGRPGDHGRRHRNHHSQASPAPRIFSRASSKTPNAAPSPSAKPNAPTAKIFAHLPIVTIDGETARDFDDAVYVERRADGGWHLQVHIADVSHYVRIESALDHEARLRGTSVYFPDRAVPMLPESLSNGMCSLKPREERLVLSALMEFDAAGNMQRARMTPGVIRSFERMTYTNVNKVIEKDPEMSERYAPLAKHFAQHERAGPPP